MKYVEIIGPPGSGKTTIIKELASRWRPYYIWDVVSADRVKKHIVFRISSLVQRMIQEIRKKNHSAGKIAEQNHLYFYAKKNKKFFDYYWCKVREVQKDSFWAMGALNWLHKTSNVVSRLNYLKSDKIALLDEGFLHRIIHLYPISLFMPFKNIFAQDLLNFLKVAPLPNGIICIDTPPDVLCERYLDRKWIISLYHDEQGKFNPNLLSAEHTRTSLIVDIIQKEYHIPVVKLSGLDDPKINARKAMSFLEDLYHQNVSNTLN